MQIADAELRPRHVHRQVHLTAARQILDVAVPAVLRSPGDRPRSFLSDFLRDVIAARPDVYALCEGWVSDVAALVPAFVDQGALALIPGGEDLGRGRAAEDSGVDEAGEANPGDVTRGAVDACSPRSG